MKRSGIYKTFIGIVTQKPGWVFAGIILLNLLLHTPFLTKELSGIHLWRQAETQSAILNMAAGKGDLFHTVVNNTAIHPDGLKRMEFPLMQWVFSWFYRIFGDSPAISRLLSFLIGCLSLWGMFRLGSTLFRSSSAGLLMAWALCWSPVFFYYSINPMPDNFALMCGIWSLALYFRGRQEGRWSIYLASACLLGLSILTKLPFILFGLVPFVGALQDLGKIRQEGGLWWVKTNAFYLLALIPAAAWYLTVMPEWQGNGVIAGILGAEASDFSELLGYFQGLLISTLPELFINYGAVGLFLAGIFWLFRSRIWKHRNFLPLAGLLSGFLAYLIFEINMITTVHDYYLFPVFPVLLPVIVLGGLKLWDSRSGLAKALVVLSILALPVTAWLRCQDRWNPSKSSIGTDFYLYQDDLIHAVEPEAKVIVANSFSPYSGLYLIRKNGASFHISHHQESDWETAMAIHPAYLYSDSRELEQLPFVVPALKKQVAEFGAVRIFELKN